MNVQRMLGNTVTFVILRVGGISGGWTHGILANRDLVGILRGLG